MHTQSFYTIANTSTYTSRTCDYKETEIISGHSDINILGNVTEFNTTIIAMPSVNTASYINIRIIPYQDMIDNNATYIYVEDTIGNNVTALKILRNTTAKSLCINHLNNSAIYCDYGTNTYDDLQDVNITLYYDFISKTMTKRFIFDRATVNDVLLSGSTFSGNDLTNLVFYTENMTLKDYSMTTITQPSGVYVTQPNDATFLQCQYDNTGCYTVRTYNNDNPVPEYDNYKDYKVCVDKLSASASELEQPPSGELTTSMKFIITISIMIIIFLIFFVMGLIFGSIKIFTIVGIVLSLFTLIMASIPSTPLIGGGIPLWVTALLMIISVVLGILIIVRPMPQ